LDLAPRDRVVLDILGRHPFLADGAVAEVVGRNVGGHERGEWSLSGVDWREWRSLLSCRGPCVERAISSS